MPKKFAVQHNESFKIARLEKEMLNVKKTTEQFRHEVKVQIATAITAAFAFIIALFWKDVITEGVNSFLQSLGLTGTAYYYRIISALIVTAIAVLGIWYFSKWSQAEEKK